MPVTMTAVIALALNILGLLVGGNETLQLHEVVSKARLKFYLRKCPNEGNHIGG